MVPWIPLLVLPLALLHLIWGVLGVALLAGRHAAYVADLRRNRFPAALALYYLPGVALYAAALLNSEWRYARGSVAWKGREYPVSRDIVIREKLPSICWQKSLTTSFTLWFI